MRPNRSANRFSVAALEKPFLEQLSHISSAICHHDYENRLAFNSIYDAIGLEKRLSVIRDTLFSEFWRMNAA